MIGSKKNISISNSRGILKGSVQRIVCIRGTSPIFDSSNVLLSDLNSTTNVPGSCHRHRSPPLCKILRYVDHNLIPIVQSGNSFHFGDVVVRSVGLIEVAIKFLTGIPDIMVLMDVFPVDVTALLGLDVFEAERL